MAKINVETVVKAFNIKYGTFYRYGSESVSNAVNACNDKFTTDELLKYIDILELPDGQAPELYIHLNPMFVEMYLGQREPVNTCNDVIEVVATPIEMPQINSPEISPENQTNMSFDINPQLGLENVVASYLINSVAPQLSKEIKKDVDKYIKEEYGEIQRTEVIDFQVPSRNGHLQGEVTHEKFDEVLQFVLADEPVLLTGEAGTGKNVICKQVAKAMNLEFYFSNAVTQEYKLTGFIDANGTYQETQFYKAFKNGGLFMLDEIDASIPEVLIILNAAIANRYFDFPNGKIEAHPDFRIVAAGNTYGNGASYMYVGRNQLDGASLDRFAVVEVGYSKKIEKQLTDDKNLLKFIRGMRKACEKAGINHIISYRAITRMNKMKDVLGIEECLKTCLIKNLEKDDMNVIVGSFNDETNEWEEGFKKCIKR